MSIITLFTKNAPTIAGQEFDAILEDTLDLKATVTSYPIESGAQASDHVIIEPYRYSIVGAVSNNPLRPVATDFVGALTDSPFAGLAAGLLSGSDETRASSALSFLITLMTNRQPFDVDAGDVTLSNMIVAELSRTKDPENENGLIFIARLQEYPELDTLLSDRTIRQSQLQDGDPSKSQLAELVNKGEKIARDAGQSVRDAIGSIFG
jgi:hypothetical protein